MTIHRYAARRDANEPEIRKRFTHHGWHTEQVSGAGMPDLMCWPKTNGRGGWRICLLVDVKHGPSVATSVQKKKWAELAAKGIPVYIVRGEADVDALVAGALEPWAPARPLLATLKGRARAAEVARRLKAKEPVYGDYTPPRSTPVDAAKSVPGLGSEFMKEFLKPPGQEDYDAAIKRALTAAKEAEVFAPPDDGA